MDFIKLGCWGGGRECGMGLSGYGSGPIEKTIRLRVPQNRKKKNVD